MPGTRYAWHELTVKLTDAGNYKLICEAVLKEVGAVYEGHRLEIEQQYKGVEDQMQIQHAAEMDEKLTEALVDLFDKKSECKEWCGVHSCNSGGGKGIKLRWEASKAAICISLDSHR